MIEREVKIRVASHEPLRPLLTRMGAIFIDTVEETNQLLDKTDHPLQRQHQVLRVRSARMILPHRTQTRLGVAPVAMQQSDDPQIATKTTLTWKGPRLQDNFSNHKIREELEVLVSAESRDALLELFAHLGFHDVLHYHKQRETWRWQGVEIALDSLEYGTFVEIEGEASAIHDAIHALQLDQEPIESRSYASLQREFSTREHSNKEG